MTVSLLRDPSSSGPGPAVAALVFCGEDAEGGEEHEDEMEHDGEGKGNYSSRSNVIISLSHAGLAAPGDTIPGAEDYATEGGGGGGGLLRGHGTRAGGVDLVAAATAAAATAATGGGMSDATSAGAAPSSSSSSSGKGLFATVAGQVSRVDRLVRVAPALPGARYSADVGDVVVGRVAEVSGKRWRVDLGGKHDAALALSAVSLPPVAVGGGASATTDEAGMAGIDEEGDDDGGGGGTAASPTAASSAAAVVARRRGAEDEASMREILKEGDLLSAEVQAVHASDGSLLLHARSSKYGKLTSPGQLVKLPASSVGRQRQQFNELRGCGVSVILGVNGWVWVSPLAHASSGKRGDAAASDRLLLDGRRAVAVASAALRALSALGVAVTPRSIERAVGVAAVGKFAPGKMEEEYLLAVARAERGAR